MLFLHIFTSLDGYIEDAGGGIDWMRESDAFDSYITGLLAEIDGMIFGRVAHEVLAQYWPSAGERPGARPIDVEMARLMNEKPKHVLSRSGQAANWRNSHPIDVEGVAALKREARGDIALFAGAGAAQALLAAGLVDEIQLFVNPVLLGGGKRLFAEAPPRDLRLVASAPMGPELVKLTYAVT